MSKALNIDKANLKLPPSIDDVGSRGCENPETSEAQACHELEAAET